MKMVILKSNDIEGSEDLAKSSDPSISLDLRITIFMAGSAYSPSTFSNDHLYEPLESWNLPAHSKAPSA